MNDKKGILHLQDILSLLGYPLALCLFFPLEEKSLPNLLFIGTIAHNGKTTNLFLSTSFRAVNPIHSLQMTKYGLPKVYVDSSWAEMS